MEKINAAIAPKMPEVIYFVPVVTVFLSMLLVYTTVGGNLLHP